MRIAGVIQLFSNAYLTKKTMPRKSANPPIHAKSFTPRRDSQLNAGCGFGATVGRAAVVAAVCGCVTEVGNGGGTDADRAGCAIGFVPDGSVPPRRCLSSLIAT